MPSSMERRVQSGVTCMVRILTMLVLLGMSMADSGATEGSPCHMSEGQNPESDSAAHDRPTARHSLPFDYGWSLSADYQHNEYSLGFTPSFQWRRYRLDGPMVNLTLERRDPYNSDRTNFSVFGLGELGMIMIGAFFYPEVVGETVSYVVNGAIITICALFNSQHHFDLIRHGRSPAARRWGLSMFGGIKSEYFPKWSDGWNEWVRFNYSLGGEVQLLTRQSKDRFNRLSLQSGLRWQDDIVTIDNVDYEYSSGPHLFVSVKYIWGRRGSTIW